MSMFSIASSNVTPGLRDRLLERVEVDADEVDRLDAVLLHRGDVLGVVALGEQAAVDLRVQRLDPAVHHLGEAGDLADVGDGQPLRRGGTCAVPPVLMQLDAELVVQRAWRTRAGRSCRRRRSGRGGRGRGRS